MSKLTPRSQRTGELTTWQKRLNVICLGADLTMFMTANGLVGSLTLAPLFVNKLTNSPLAVGALTAIFQLGWLPQLVAAGYLERSRRKRAWLVGFGLLERLPVLGLAAAALLATTLATPLVLALAYLSRFLQSLAAGPSATVWLDYVARAVSPRQRGSFMGYATMLGNLLGAVVASLIGPILDHFGYPTGFAVCFGLGCAILLVAWFPLILVIDPTGPPPREPRPLRKQLGELPGVLRDDRAFRVFLWGMSCSGFGSMGDSFLVVYGATRLGAPDDLVAWYTASLLVGQVIGNLLLGRLADRHGFVTVARAASLASAGLATSALLAPTAELLTGSFLLLGISQAGSLMARLAGPMAFAPPARRPTYVSLSMALTSLVGALGPLLGSQIVGLLGFPWLFAGGLACATTGFFVLGRTPAARPELSPEASV